MNINLKKMDLKETFTRYAYSLCAGGGAGIAVGSMVSTLAWVPLVPEVGMGCAAGILSSCAYNYVADNRTLSDFKKLGISMLAGMATGVIAGSLLPSSPISTLTVLGSSGISAGVTALFHKHELRL